MKPLFSKTITQEFGLNDDEFLKTGALNSVLNIDSRLFLDPSLLRETDTPEFAKSYPRLLDTFQKVFVLLKHSKSEGDRFWQSAVSLLYGKEIQGLCIGYSNSGTAGSGFGPALINQLLSCGKDIIEAGVQDPEIFELVGLIEEGVGPDRISDLVCRIIADDIYRYSESTFSQFNLERHKVNYKDKEYLLPLNPYNGQPVNVLPQTLLSDLPLSLDWTNADIVLRHNQALRSSINQIIGDTWKKASQQNKNDLKNLMLKNPDLIRDVINLYKNKAPKFYDFEKDPSGQVIWKKAADAAVSRYPLKVKLSSPEEISAVIRLIIEKFKDLVENNGMWDLFYKDAENPKYESASQLLFYGIADSYCAANNIDLIRECNAGRGPVDFKFSQGYENRVVVEIKLSSNTRLEHGYTKQIEEYKKAEKTQFAMCIIIHVVGGSSKRVNAVQDKHDALKKASVRCPELYIIDAIPKDSASKFKL